MGKLRSGILDLQKVCVELDPKIDKVTDQQEEYSQRVYAAGERIKEGMNALVMYLLEKFKKDKTTFDAQAGKKLKEVADSNVATLIKGIMQAKSDVKSMVAKLNAEHKKASGALLASINESVKAAKALEAIAEKKKNKWLKSSKYKAKIKSYLDALGAVATILDKQMNAAKAVEAINQNDTWVDRNYKISVDMTMKEIRGIASVDFNSNLKDFFANQKTIENHVRKFRDEYKSMGGQLAMMKKWVGEADEMEEESESN